MSGFTKEEITAKLPDIISFADIGDFINQPVKTYSSGMFVRLAFAVAINIEPEILIVDEALSVGDVFFQAKCYKKFEDFKKEGKTILFVSHDLGSITRYCDRVVLLNKGVKLAEGTPRDMVNLYKKVLVGQVDVDSVQKGKADIHSTTGAQTISQQAGAQAETGGDQGGQAENEGKPHQKKWMDNFQINPDVNEYGSGKAEIVDFGVTDENGQWTGSIMKGTRFQIHSRVHFFEDIDSPIFTYTFRNLQGVAITGTNTMYERADIGRAAAGSEYTCVFEQDMNLQGGEYLLSISCTGYKDGDFVVYHRLYDVINITVISDKNTVGFYDMNSKVTISKE